MPAKIQQQIALVTESQMHGSSAAAVRGPIPAQARTLF